MSDHPRNLAGASIPSLMDERMPWVAEGVVAGGLWFGMNELLHLRLGVAEFAGTLSLLIAGILVEMAGGRWLPGWKRIAPLLAAAVSGALLMLFAGAVTPSLSGAHIAYAVVLVTAARLGWRRWRVPPDLGRAGEHFRRLAVGAGALAVVYPFFTDRFLGGTDAKWYALMLTDFIEQARSGQFPVLVGQGEHAFSGAIHPFRSAPLYLWLAWSWDLVTLRGLSMLALQHLTVLTAAIAAGWSMYCGLCAVGLPRRWIAAAVALIYVISPAVMMNLYCVDMYMTFMAAGVLPLVACGNARVLVSEDRHGWRMLAAGLALTWMAHPPSGMLATVVTAVVHGMRLAFADHPLSHARHYAMGAGWFLGLGAYYFVSMAEVPAESGPQLWKDAIPALALMLTVFGMVQGVGMRRWKMLPLGLAGIGLAVGAAQPWGWWTLVFAAILSLAWIGWRGRKIASDALGVVVVCAVAMIAAAVVWKIVGEQHAAFDRGTTLGLQGYAEHWEKFFLPLSSQLSLKWDYQPGAAVWLLLLAGLAAACFRRNFAAALVTTATIFLLITIVRVPWTSDFFVGYAPSGISYITNLPLALRIMPVAAVFACVAGFLAAARISGRAWKAGIGAGIILLLVWSAKEAAAFVKRGGLLTNSRSLTIRGMLPENAVMARFAYDLLRIPSHFSHGKTDPRLEQRILNLDGTVRVGPDVVAGIMETHGRERVPLRAATNTLSPDWLKISPAITILPGETKLLRFEFVPGKNYAGFLMFKSEADDYREYIMPNSGMPGAFGVDAGRSKVISLWNSTGEPVEYALSMPRGAGNDVLPPDEPSALFATVNMSRYLPERSPVEIKSFVPYRAVVRMARAGRFETSRYFIPGYKALVDGLPVAIEKSADNLVTLPLSEGDHTVEVRYVGTWKMGLAGAASLSAWLALAIVTVRGARRED